MPEKYQYGQQLNLQVLTVLNSLKTSKSNVSYVRTLNHGDVLFMDDEIQLSTLDEYRYHEMLVHPVMKRVTCSTSRRLDVLILGGGDGCAAREVYKWLNVHSVTIVDYDKEFVNVFGKGVLAPLNKHVYTRSNLTYVAEDAIRFLETTYNKYDVVIIDLPDPDSAELLTVYLTTLMRSKLVTRTVCGLAIHVGPILLNPDHPNWEMISNFRDVILHSFNERNPIVKLNSCYVPTFSNEWGFLHMSTLPETYTVDTKEIEDLCRYWTPECDNVLSLDIYEIYRRLL